MSRTTESIHDCRILEGKRVKILYALGELKERCRHPKECVVNADQRTFCALCGAQFWPSGSFYLQHSVLTPDDLSNICETRLRLEREYRDVAKSLDGLQEDCPHPCAAVVAWGEDTKCTLCHKFNPDVVAE